MVHSTVVCQGSVKNLEQVSVYLLFNVYILQFKIIPFCECGRLIELIGTRYICPESQFM